MAKFGFGAENLNREQLDFRTCSDWPFEQRLHLLVQVDLECSGRIMDDAHQATPAATIDQN